MPWTWVRPGDPTVLDGRPLLDLGTGDGQTLGALVGHEGFIVGVDRSLDALRTVRSLGKVWPVCAEADVLPFREGTFETVLAGDLFHHLPGAELSNVLLEARRVLRTNGRLVAWWYEREGRGGPDSPLYPRAYASVDDAARTSGFARAEPLELTFTIEPAPPTVGIVATV